MTITDWKKEYTEEATDLAVQAYKEAARNIPNLPNFDVTGGVSYVLNDLNECSKYGKAAFEDGKLVGFLRFYGAIEGFHGSAKGAFCPMGGSAFMSKTPAKTASMLYQEAAADLVRDGITSHAVCLYSYNQKICNSFMMNGFGARCSDAILNLTKGEQPKAKIHDMEVRQLNPGEEACILPLHQGLVRHMAAAPAFYPSNGLDLLNYYEKKGERVYVAFDGGEAIGFMCLNEGKGGETFITYGDYINNIGGAFVKPEYRGRQVADQILEYISNVSRDEGKTFLGVDCETINPTALRFWGKHFDYYTFSFARRIDERICGYEEYMENEWKRLYQGK